MTKLLTAEINKQIKDLFTENLEYPVELVFFGDTEDCEYCPPTRQLVEEVTELSNLLSARYYDIRRDSKLAKQYQVDKTPGIILIARDGEEITDYGIRFAGVPSGHEFTSLINDIIMVSSRSSGLNDETKKFIQSLKTDVLLQVFVTPT